MKIAIGSMGDLYATLEWDGATLQWSGPNVEAARRIVSYYEGQGLAGEELLAAILEGVRGRTWAQDVTGQEEEAS